MKLNLLHENWLPDYITKRGKLLFIDYDNIKRNDTIFPLRGIDGKFWGYSNDKKIDKERDPLESNQYVAYKKSFDFL